MAPRNVPANRNAAAAPAPAPPTLPTSVALVLKDPIDHQTGATNPSLWAPPRWPIPNDQLEQARAAIEHMLKPIGAAGVKAALVPLMLTQQLENLDNLPAGFEPAAYLHQKSAEYERHLAHFPFDILRGACDAHARASKFFPAVAELIAHAGPALELRQRQRDRIGVLITASNPARKAAEEVPAWKRHDLTADERKQWAITRTRELIEMKQKRGMIDGIERLERELAQLEGRPYDAPAVAEPPLPAEPITGTLPRDDRNWDKAGDAGPSPAELERQRRAEHHAVKGGQPPRMEEPPMPDEIPEGPQP